MFWRGNIDRSPVFASYHIFAPGGYIESYLEGAIFRFHETKKYDPIMAATNLFGNIINIHPFEDGNVKICRLILAHVLIQMKCCLFPVILSSFHRRGRRHYIRAVKMFHRKLSMLYSMIVRSLIHCWDNFKQNAKMTSPGPEIIIKMSSVMPFSFNAVELCFVTINEKPWTRVREVCKALECNKKNANIVKNHCSKEIYTQRYQLSSVPAAVTPVD